jgi:GT2 family glycosyltransferase
MENHVSIVVPAHNQLDYCRQCVSSLLENTDWPHKLILVDNGSTDGVSDFFDAIPGAVVVHSEKNLGFAAGVNLGLSHAEGHVLLLNSDTIVPKQWLSRLVNVLLDDPRRGAVGPVSNYVSGIQQIETPPLNSMDEINRLSAELFEKHGSAVRFTQRLVGFCLLVREGAFQQIGRLDEQFGIGNCEDDDYCFRILREGYRCCVADGCFVFHYGNRTFQSLGVVDDSFSKLCDANRLLLSEKWTEVALRPISQSIAAAAFEVYEAGDFGDAVRLMKEAIALGPRVAQNYATLGEMLWSNSVREKALVYFRKAASLAPDDKSMQDRARDAESQLGAGIDGGAGT